MSDMTPSELNDRRNEAIRRYHEREEQRFKETLSKKREQDTHAVRAQMEVDDQKRKFVKKAHNAILNEERKQLADEMQKLE